jgi:hypothetical protein
MIAASLQPWGVQDEALATVTDADTGSFAL